MMLSMLLKNKSAHAVIRLRFIYNYFLGMNNRMMIKSVFYTQKIDFGPNKPEIFWKLL
jgi:hypothetical protein